jgi:hypothetical protein
MQRERRGDPSLARALDAEGKLRTALELLKKSEGERRSYQTRVEALEASKYREVRDARAAVADKADKVAAITSKTVWSREAAALEGFMKRYQNVFDWPELMMRVLVRQETDDGEDLTFWVESCPVRLSPRSSASSTTTTWRSTTTSRRRSSRLRRASSSASSRRARGTR